MRDLFWSKFRLGVVILFTSLIAVTFAQAGIISQEVLDAAVKQERIQVIVTLKDQPTSEIAQRKHALHLPAVDQLTDEVKLLTEPFKFNDIIPEPIKQQVKGLRVQQEGLLEAMRRAIYDDLAPRIRPQQDRVVAFVENELNGNVRARILLVNTLGVEIPSKGLERLAEHQDVRLITMDSEGKAELNVSHKAIEADYVWGKIKKDPTIGDSVTDVVVVDTGVFMQHSAFSGHSGPQRNFIPQGQPGQVGDNDGHGTGVAGIIASNDTTYKGVAHRIDKIINAKVSNRHNDGNEDTVMQAVEWAVNGLIRGAPSPGQPNNELAEIVNLSLG